MDSKYDNSFKTWASTIPAFYCAFMSYMVVHVPGNMHARISSTVNINLSSEEMVYDFFVWWKDRKLYVIQHCEHIGHIHQLIFNNTTPSQWP